MKSALYFAPITLAVLLAGAPVMAYEFIELPTLGGHSSSARGINNHNVVVGESFAGLGPPDATHAFRYSGGAMTDLGTLPGQTWPPPWSDAQGINDNGVIVGSSNYTQRNEFVFHAFRWTNGVMQDLGDLGGGASVALAINNMGAIVGRSHTSNAEIHGYVYTDGQGMIDLGTHPGADRSVAEDINDAGLIVGSAALEPTPTYAINACIWRDGQIIDLGNLGRGRFDQSAAHGVNNANVVVGETTITGSLAYHAFRWTETEGMVDLGTMMDGASSFANDINNWGDIVGYHRLPNQVDHASLYTRGRWIDLHAEYFPSWQNSVATAINDRGWIVGLGTNETGQSRGWMLLIPEPASLMLLALGIPVSMRQRRMSSLMIGDR